MGLLAWLLAGGIARTLTTNMTLMLRPEVWRQMYSASAMGRFLPTGDPTLTPRWLLMLAGGVFIGGLWLIYLSGAQHLHARTRRNLPPGWAASWPPASASFICSPACGRQTCSLKP